MLRALYELGNQMREGAEAFASAVGAPVRPTPGTTPRATVMVDGAASLYRIARTANVPSMGKTPVLLVPSPINRWYVLDLYPSGSIVKLLADAGVDTFVLDWGVARDEDRSLSWDDMVDRLSRMMAMVRRTTGAEKVVLLGYSLAGTLSVITAARESSKLAGLINLAGPVDFSLCGKLKELTDPRWLDADLMASAGNIAPAQMLGGFLALRPTQMFGDAVKVAGLHLTGRDEERDAALALSGWAYDAVPFPARAWADYVKALYQRNELVRAEHRVKGERVDLARIECPLLTIVADKDVITPPASALALEALVGSADKQTLVASGGHVSGVVNPKAKERFHPALLAWLRARVAAADAVHAV